MSVKKYKKVVDNNMRSFGETDFDKHLIRINKKMNKTKGSRGELINTIVHEEYHARHPKAHEKTTKKMSDRIVNKMGPMAKKKLYAQYRHGKK